MIFKYAKSRPPDETVRTHFSVMSRMYITWFRTFALKFPVAS